MSSRFSPPYRPREAVAARAAATSAAVKKPVPAAKKPAPPPPKPAFPPSNPPAPSPLKRALMIGINQTGDPWNELRGCINDVLHMKERFSKIYPKCKEIRILTDTATNPAEQTSKESILRSIAWLVEGLQAGESVQFHQSGHGGQILDSNGDEVSGQDSCIYPQVNGQVEIITDDELRTALVNKIPKGCKCFAVFDCCHSGSILDLRYTLQAPAVGKVVMTQDDRQANSGGSVVLLSGCRDDQASADAWNAKMVPSGALTNALLDVWSKQGINIKFKYLLWDLREMLSRQGFEQVPQLSCSSSIGLSDMFQL